MQRQSTGFLLALTVAAALLTGGCDDPEILDESDDRPRASSPAQFYENLGEELGEDAIFAGDAIVDEPLATISGWTRYTSEEFPPITCEQTSMITALGCAGRYCDNVRIYCTPTGLAGGDTSWSSYFSEETGGAGNRRFCGDRQWMVGVACRGRYCDDVSIQCRYFANTAPTGCYWTGWISEEGGGTLYFGLGYYARGMECQGSYCDNKRLYVCRLS